MWRSVNLGIVVFGIILYLIHNVMSLKCWTCKSNDDITCGDYFNATARMRYNTVDHFNSNVQPVHTYPTLEYCDDLVARYHDRNVCLKVVIKGDYKTTVERRCHLMSRDVPVGKCPSEVERQEKSIAFCGTCDRDECNGAIDLSISLFLLIAGPFVLFFITRQ